MQLLLFTIANAFMGNVKLLGTTSPNTTVTDPNDTSHQWVKDVAGLIKKIIGPALIIAGTAGMVYAIVLGVKMAKADEQGKRDEAKKNLINVLIAIVATVLLIALFYLFTHWLETGALDTWLFPGGTSTTT